MGDLTNSNERIDLLAKIEKSIEHCKTSSSKIEGIHKLIKLLEAEKLFFNKKEYYTEKDLKSTNYHFLGDLCTCLTLLPNSGSILKSFKTHGNSSVRADILTDRGRQWIKVISKNTKALNYSLDENCVSKKKSLKEQIEELIDASEYNKFEFKAPKIVVIFFHVIPLELLEELKLLNVDICQVINNELHLIFQSSAECTEHSSNFQNYYQKSETILDFLCHDSNCICKKYLKISKKNYRYKENDVRKVNLDVSTMIALVSNQCHGHHKLECNEDYLRQQALQESSNPVLVQLFTFLLGKEIFACETTIDSFKSIVSTIAGPNEKKRAENLLEMVVKQKDQESNITLELSLTAKISKRSLVIFGTGDFLKAITTTSNTSFIRAVQQKGVGFCVFVHSARSLTEKKEIT